MADEPEYRHTGISEYFLQGIEAARESSGVLLQQPNPWLDQLAYMEKVREWSATQPPLRFDFVTIAEPMTAEQWEALVPPENRKIGDI